MVNSTLALSGLLYTFIVAYISIDVQYIYISLSFTGERGISGVVGIPGTGPSGRPGAPGATGPAGEKVSTMNTNIDSLVEVCYTMNTYIV